MDSQISSSSRTQENAKKKTPVSGLVVLGVVGSALVGLYAAAFPFVSPALRKVCLPFVPATPLQVTNVMKALSGRKGNVIDLGSGDGRLVIEAARMGFVAEGVELNYWLVCYSRLRSWRLGFGPLTRFSRRDLFKANLGDYRNIIIFGTEQMMGDLETKVMRELTGESCVIACRFPFPNISPARTIGHGIDAVWVYEKTPL